MVKILSNTILKTFLFLIFLKNRSRFKKTKVFFINFHAFGHSVKDTLNFFDAFGSSGVCISVGSSLERNKYIKKMVMPHILLNFWVPTWKYRNQSLRKIVGPKIIYILNNSFLFRRFYCGEVRIVEYWDIHNELATKIISRSSGKSEHSVHKMISELQVNFLESMNKNSAGAFLLDKLEHNLKLNNSFAKSSTEFFSRIEKIKHNSHIITLILRRTGTGKAWSSGGLSTYSKCIATLIETGYTVIAIGDIEELINLQGHIPILQSVLTKFDFNLDHKLFELIAVQNSFFCLGDASGTQTLPRMFRKQSIIYNVMPFASLYSNTIAVPKIWKTASEEIASWSDHTGELNYRLNSYTDRKSRKTYTPHAVTTEIANIVLEKFLIHLKSELLHDSKLLHGVNFLSEIENFNLYSPKY